jgi:3-oxoacyl-[acyl-carrier protein] reductase
MQDLPTDFSAQILHFCSVQGRPGAVLAWALFWVRVQPALVRLASRHKRRLSKGVPFDSRRLFSEYHKFNTKTRVFRIFPQKFLPRRLAKTKNREVKYSIMARWRGYQKVHFLTEGCKSERRSANMRLKGKTALITGAGRGIGYEIAVTYAKEGANLGLNYVRSKQQTEVLATKLEKEYGIQTLVLPADVGDQDQVQRMFEAMFAKFGVIDILVNNAGMLTQVLCKDMSYEIWAEMIRNDLTSVFLCTKAVLPHMLERKYGRIINVASQLGQIGGVELTHYAAAKAGVIGFTKSLAREVGEYGITVNCLAPGPIETDMVACLSDEWKKNKLAGLPLHRFGKSEEVAPSAVFLAADPDGNLFTGQTLGPNSGDVML